MQKKIKTFGFQQYITYTLNFWKKITQNFFGIFGPWLRENGQNFAFFSYFWVFLAIYGLLDWSKPINFAEHIVTS